MKHISPIIIIAVLLLAGNVTITQTVQRDDAARAGSDPPVVERLGAIVSIRQTMAQANERAVQGSKGETDGRNEIALAEARLQLARELAHRDEEVTALKDILKVQERRLQDAKKRADVGAASPDDMDTIRVAVLEAEVRLLRTQKSTKGL
jgi:outer membrane protein TolC